MRRFTLRLPETLFQKLEMLAEWEGVSLNQFLVYSLTKTAARAYQVVPLSKEEIENQKVQYESVIDQLSEIGQETFDRIIAEGEPVERYNAINPELAERIEEKIAAAKSKNNKKNEDS